MPRQPDNLISYLRLIVAPWRDDPRDDAELLSRFAKTRDETAFATLVGRHGPLVWRTCRQILGNTPDAEDALQTVFLVMSRKAGRFTVTSLVGWLHRVARQTALNAQMSARRRRRLKQELQTVSQPQAEKNSDEIELTTALDEELVKLPEKLRVPLLLHYLEGKSQVEVARVLGCAQSTLHERLKKGETILRKRLERRGLTLGTASVAALLGNSTGAPAVPARLIGSTARAAVTFRAGSLTGETADGAQKLLRSLAMKGAVQKIWWMVLVSTGFLGVGGAGVVAWKMCGGGSDAVTPAIPGTHKIAAPETLAKSHAERLDLYGDPLPDGALARIGTLRFRSGSPRFEMRGGDIKFLPDGKTIVSSHDDGIVHFWELATGREFQRLNGPGGKASQKIAVSSDGKKLAVVGREEAWVWDLNANPPRLLLKNVHGKHVGVVKVAAAFSSDDKTLAVVVKITGPGLRRLLTLIRLLDVTTGKLIRTINTANTPETILAFSPDGRMLAAGNTVWNVATGEELCDALKTDGSIQSLAFSTDGKTLAIATQKSPGKGFISLWNTATGAKICQVASDGELFLAFLPDGQTLLEFNVERRVRFRDSVTGKEKMPALICSHEGWLSRSKNLWLNGMCLSPDGKMLGEVSRSFVAVYDLATGRQAGPVGGGV